MKQNYYVLIPENRKIDGPFTFKESMKKKMEYSSFGIPTKILKVVINEWGKEVK